MVVGAMQGALDVAQDRVNPSERWITGACRSTSGHERMVNTPGELHSTKTGQGVGEDDGTGLEVAPGPDRDLLAAKPADTAPASCLRGGS